MWGLCMAGLGVCSLLPLARAWSNDRTASPKGGRESWTAAAYPGRRNRLDEQLTSLLPLVFCWCCLRFHRIQNKAFPSTHICLWSPALLPFTAKCILKVSPNLLPAVLLWLLCAPVMEVPPSPPAVLLRLFPRTPGTSAAKAPRCFLVHILIPATFDTTDHPFLPLWNLILFVILLLSECFFSGCPFLCPLNVDVP